MATNQPLYSFAVLMMRPTHRPTNQPTSRPTTTSTPIRPRRSGSPSYVDQPSNQSTPFSHLFPRLTSDYCLPSQRRSCHSFLPTVLSPLSSPLPFSGSCCLRACVLPHPKLIRGPGPGPGLPIDQVGRSLGRHSRAIWRRDRQPTTPAHPNILLSPPQRYIPTGE